jgi:putative redox protein
VNVRLRQIAASASEAAMGDHRVIIDRPDEKGGTNAGPMGGQLFLASVGGCFMSNLLAAIRARDAAVTDVEIEVAAAYAENPARFSALDLSVTASCADPDQLSKLVDIADRGCIMMNTLRGKLDVRIRIAASVSG